MASATIYFLDIKLFKNILHHQVIITSRNVVLNRLVAEMLSENHKLSAQYSIALNEAFIFMSSVPKR